MIEKTVARLMESLQSPVLRGDPRTVVRGLAYDSRRVEAGDLFVALRGLHTDGHGFVEQALGRGAAVVVHDRELPDYRKGIAYLRVEDSRRAMSELAADFYENPSRQLSVVGVTGTDGKSTTVWLIHQLLERLGIASGFISTVQVKTGCEVAANPLRQSTPEAPDIHWLLRQMVDAGKSHAVIEATSHGLSRQTGRLAAVEFAAAVHTNISHEHLEFHGTLERYRSDKANLFRALPRDGLAVVNLDDPHHLYLAAQTRAPVLRYSLADSRADLYAESLETDLSGSRFTLCSASERQKVRLGLPGTFNVANFLASALTVLHLRSLHLAELASHIPALQSVPGRMQGVSRGQPFRVIVDYAHTPESFTRLFPLVRTHTPGKLIAVFGSAGERDVAKRSRQGEIAARYCDLLVLADEDPRGEEPLEILEEIASGCLRAERPAVSGSLERQANLLLIPDRRQALRQALSRARAGDTVLLLGKGHERSIIYADGPRPWDEAGAAFEILGELGFEG